MSKGLSEALIWRPANTITKRKRTRKIEDAKGAIRNRKLKTIQHNNQKKKDKKGLKMPNGLSEAVTWRPDNTITKKKKGQEKFEDAKRAIRNRNLKARQHNSQKKKDKKSLKMPKGLSEAVIWRPDNTITKRKRTRKVWRCQRDYQKP